ncbi:MAG: ferric reductase-like transmembrane domain-containing protein [Candidatus Natronoplasma sp.]
MDGEVTKKGYYAIGAIGGLYLVVVAFFLSMGWTDIYDLTIRFFALTGLYMMSIAVLLTPFMKEIYQEWGKSFMDVHHLFAAIGIAAATLHPVIFAIDVSDISVFVPDVSSLYDFMLLGGRQALILIYIATIAAFVRSKIPKFWKPIHALMYLMLFFALVHGYMIGTDFANIGIQMIFTALFIGAIGALVYKRL